ncbi:uncharacterized protein LOC113201956 [Frankliniella occidentalis]|uniref:Uncharacterized protein LOC113201956 n=1 Tax=Frankliniella occidentalis TaxID=133901 RepID=A0A6J1RRP8_FRAOC|nr:uncharacterized protein LOC113201956 [Frankliniella occidentalis]
MCRCEKGQAVSQPEAEQKGQGPEAEVASLAAAAPLRIAPLFDLKTQFDLPQKAQHGASRSRFPNTAMELEQLPDEVVMLVLGYVAVDDLFAFRLVCKRLGGLALHPGVWRHRRRATDRRTISNDPDGPKKLCRLLRLAPRLASLYVPVESTQDHHFPLYATTRCAVRRLNLDVSHAGSVPAALIVRNQEALGHLTVVVLTFFSTVVDAAVLLGTLASTSVLKKLEVRHGWLVDGLSAGSLHYSVARPSLTYFKCHLTSDTQPFVDLVLAGHAATLETVDLGGPRHISHITTSTGCLPACMPNLRDLNCSLLPGMETLAPSLTNVTLHVTPEMRLGVLGAAEMLRRASKLRYLTLKYCPAARTSAYVGVDLVEALALSGRSAVQVLDIDNDRENELADEENDDGVEYLPQLQPLVRALPSLPALRHLMLSVYVPPDELLLAITPQTAPALRELMLYPMRWLPARCAHDWRHKDSVQTLLSRNPVLKFSVLTSPYCLKGQRCGACAQGCHNTLWEWDWDLEFDEHGDVNRSEFQDLIHIR